MFGRFLSEKYFTIRIVAKIFIIFLSIFFNNYAFANNQNSKILEIEEIKNSVSNFYPQILAEYEKIEIAKGNLQEAKGVFDIKLKQEYINNSRGYYDGTYFSNEISRQNRFLNSTISAGYRQSDGTFPDYDGNYNTTNRGEVNANIKLSLLKDRAIDKNRLGEILAYYNLEESEIHLKNLKIQILRDAIKAYWDWAIAAQIYDINKNLYQLSLKRQDQLENRFSNGDIARILLVENRKNLLSRKNQMIDAKRMLDNSAIKLSLFYRDKNGQQILVKEDVAPILLKKHSLKLIDDISNSKSVKLALQKRPEVLLIEIEQKSARQNLKYAKNLLQPQLDIKAGISRDMGDGPIATEQSRNFIKADLSLPLQLNEARGKIQAANSQLKSLDYEKQLANDKITNEINQLTINVNNTILMYNNAKEEVLLAKELEDAERQKFDNGASNFFLVNFREQDSANSQIKKMLILQKYYHNITNYQAAIFDL